MFNKAQSYVCEVDGSLDETSTEPFVGNLTFYRFNLILSGAAMGISCLVIFFNIFLHATHLSKPAEQIKIIKIAMFIPAYAGYSYLTLALPRVQAYLLPWRDVVEGIALALFFILLCEFISPSDNEREIFFAGLELPKKKNGEANDQDPLVWYRRKWIAVFQFPFISILVAIITDITEATGNYCLTSYSIHFAHLWMFIISNVSITICLLAIFAFYKALKPTLSTQRPLAKFFAFKGIIGVTFLVNIIYAIVHAAGGITASAKLNYADVSVGIPTLVILLTLVPLSFFFHYAYSYHPYVIEKGAYAGAVENQDLAGFKPTYQGGFLGCRAYLYAMNPSEVLRGFLFAFTLFTEEAQNRAAQPPKSSRGNVKFGAYTELNENSNMGVPPQAYPAPRSQPYEPYHGHGYSSQENGSVRY